MDGVVCGKHSLPLGCPHAAARQGAVAQCPALCPPGGASALRPLVDSLAGVRVPLPGADGPQSYFRACPDNRHLPPKGEPGLGCGRIQVRARPSPEWSAQRVVLPDKQVPASSLSQTVSPGTGRCGSHGRGLRPGPSLRLRARTLS